VLGREDASDKLVGVSVLSRARFTEAAMVDSSKGCIPVPALQSYRRRTVCVEFRQLVDCGPEESSEGGRR